ncbi:DUF6538 domain-containing protein [Aurantimonas coralicida]|uniref:DUF6538 domain-containing protein n=1 Tax=Aurantimonas coralicida TaxID=182270 RepID=UPI003C6C6208
MAVRHHVSNLVRRGNVYYWRPRLPAGASRSGRGKHLSLSLRITDHAHAKSLAMQLNARLEGIRSMVVTEAWNKEQLAILFREEIEQASRELEGFAVAARRVGSPSEDQLKADEDVGWAYRLFAVFGARRGLEFKGDCPGLHYLKRLGVPPERLPFVVDTFRQEQHYRCSPMFDEQVQGRLRDAGLDTNPLMRERAATEIARARAEVLLKSRSFYPDLAALDVVAVDQAPETVTPDEQLVTSDVKVEAAKHIRVSELVEYCQSYLSGRQQEIEARTQRDIAVVVSTFADILAEHQVETLAGMQQFHLGALRKHYNEIIPNYGKSSQLASLGAKDLRIASSRRVATAMQAGATPPVLGLSPQTIRKHLCNLDAFLKHLKAMGYHIATYDLAGLRPRKPKSTRVRDLTEKPGPDRIRVIFRMPVFIGCKSSIEQDLPGDHVFHSANYYIPLILAYLGPRRFEVAGLTVNDIVLTDNGYAIYIKPNCLRRIKNEPTIRMLPVPDELERLGFIDYVNAIKELKYTALFPELYHAQRLLSEQDAGDRFYKDFSPLVQGHFSAQDEELWARLLHAIRHGHSDTLKQNGVNGLIIDDIAGRFGEGETATRYTNPAGLPLIRKQLRFYPNITRDLVRRPLNLLPWVKEKRLPPWAERETSDSG